MHIFSIIIGITSLSWNRYQNRVYVLYGGEGLFRTILAKANTALLGGCTVLEPTEISSAHKQWFFIPHF